MGSFTPEYLSEMARVLWDAGRLGDVDDLLRFIEKPWNYEDDFLVCVQCENCDVWIYAPDWVDLDTDWVIPCPGCEEGIEKPDDWR